jgi:hypothetical protein
MDRYLHIQFNPTLGDGSTDSINIEELIKARGIEDKWSLSHIVPITPYLWVAVFECWDSDA